MAQTNYPTALANPIPGMVQGPGVDLHGFNTQEALAAGIMVVDDSVANGQRAIRPPTAAAQPYVGITHFQTNLDNQALPLNEVWPGASVVAFRRDGLMWVANEEALAIGDTLHVRHTAAGAEVLGEFRTDVDGGDAEPVAGAATNYRIARIMNAAAVDAGCLVEFRS